jgi:hypothetical protein
MMCKCCAFKLPLSCLHFKGGARVYLLTGAAIRGTIDLVRLGMLGFRSTGGIAVCSNTDSKQIQTLVDGESAESIADTRRLDYSSWQDRICYSYDTSMSPYKLRMQANL